MASPRRLVVVVGDDDDARGGSSAVSTTRRFRHPHNVPMSYNTSIPTTLMIVLFAVLWCSSSGSSLVPIAPLPLVSAFVVVSNVHTGNNQISLRHHHQQQQRRLLLQQQQTKRVVQKNRRRWNDDHSLFPFTTTSRLRSSSTNVNPEENDDDDADRAERHNISTPPSSSSSLSSSSTSLPSNRILPKVPAKPYRPLGPKLTKTVRQLDDTIFRNLVQYLAELSLQDYQWRTSVFQQNEADRMMEESMARIRFGEEDIRTNINYIRPMDAPTLGPLGKLEKYYVTLLFDVFHEEQRRAQRIIAASGKLIRPSKNTITVGEETAENNDNEADPAPVPRLEQTAVSSLGPLGRFEARVVAFWTAIQQEELLRIRTKTWRPKDLQQRGPLGQWEYYISTILEDIRSSELVRAQQAKIRNDGTIVRPIDIPGPLGEIELRVSDIIQEEFRRVREKRHLRTDNEKNDKTDINNDDNALIPSFTVLRPKDATNPGPLGAAEATAYAAIQSVSQEEMERLKAIQRTLIEYRPMNHQPPSSSSNSNNNRSVSSQQKSPLFTLLYTLETMVVGMVRAPQLLFSVVARVQELLSSTPLETDDLQMLQQHQQKEFQTNVTKTVPPMNDNDENNRKDNNNNQNHKPPPPLGEFL